jgi:hypothetical protein
MKIELYQKLIASAFHSWQMNCLSLTENTNAKALAQEYVLAKQPNQRLKSANEYFN